MTKAKSCVQRKSKYKKVFKLASGFYGRSKNCFKVAKPATLKAMQYAYIGRKVKKREYKSKFIKVVNAACRQIGSKYSEFINLLRNSEKFSTLNLRSIYTIIRTDFNEFKTLCDQLKS